MKGIYEIKKDFNYVNEKLLVISTVLGIIGITLSYVRIILGLGSEMFFIEVFFSQIGYATFLIWSIQIGLFPLITLFLYEKSELIKLTPKSKSEVLKNSLKPWIRSIGLYFFISFLLIVATILIENFNYHILGAFSIITIANLFFLIIIGQIISKRKGYNLSKLILLIISGLIIEKVLYQLILMIGSVLYKNTYTARGVNILLLVSSIVLFLTIASIVYILFSKLKDEEIIGYKKGWLEKPYNNIFSIVDKLMIGLFIIFLINVALSINIKQGEHWIIKDYIFLNPYHSTIGEVIIDIFRISLIIYTIYNVIKFYNKDNIYLEIIKNNKLEKFKKYMVLPIIIWSIYIGLYIILDSRIFTIYAGGSGIFIQLIFTIVASGYFIKDIIRIDKGGTVGIVLFIAILYLVICDSFSFVSYQEYDVSAYYFIVYCIIFILIERSINRYKVKRKKILD